MFGGEAIMAHGRLASLATSAGYGHTVSKMILMGYLDSGMAERTDFEVEVFGERYPITRVDGLHYDPANERLKG